MPNGMRSHRRHTNWSRPFPRVVTPGAAHIVASGVEPIGNPGELDRTAEGYPDHADETTLRYMRKRGTIIATSIGVMALFVARVAAPWVKSLPNSLAPLMFFAFVIVVGAGGPLLLLFLTKDDNDA